MGRSEIPPVYWAPGIQRLTPLRLYTHRVNLVVVQGVKAGEEHGKYIYLPVSSFHPVAAWYSYKHAVDGFVFRPSSDFGVYDYTRTLPVWQAR